MDPFDAMLRERFARLIAFAPGHAGRLPLLPGQTTRARGVEARRRDPRGPMSLFAGGAVILVIATLIGGAWLLAMPRTPAGDSLLTGAGVEGADAPIVWDSGLVRLEADTVRIETPNGTFRAIDVTPIPDPESGTSSARWSPSPEEPWSERPGIEDVDFVVHSDPGDGRYRTLEVTWQEAGVEMRMNIYLAADDREWWATEVRVYDGSPEGDWIGWGGGMSATFGDDERAWPSDDHESRLRAFGVPADAEVLSLSAAEGGITSVIYRDRRGRVHTIGCDKRSSGSLAGEPGTFEEAPAELCPPPPIDLGLFRSRRGETWTGDLDLVDGFGSANDEPVTGELHIKGMRLSAFDD